MNVAGFDRTYEDLKPVIDIRTGEEKEDGFDRTYEDLKPPKARKVLQGYGRRFDRTYEDLKQFDFACHSTAPALF